MYENIDKVTYLCCKVKQRPNERGVYWLESMVPGPRLAFIKADQRKGCIDILVSIDIVAIRMMRDGVVVAPLKALFTYNDIATKPTPELVPVRALAKSTMIGSMLQTCAGPVTRKS